MAGRLGVPTKTVKIWHHAGIVTGHRYNDKGQFLYHPPGPNPPTPHHGLPRSPTGELHKHQPPTNQPDEVQYAT